MQSNFICLLVLLLLTTGCASTYKSPQEGNTARIRYVNATTYDDVDVFTFDDAQCNGTTLIGALGKRKYRQEDGIVTQGMPLIDGLDRDRVKEIIVQSDKPFVSYIRKLSFSGGGFGGMQMTSCSMTFLMNPENGGLYEVVYGESGGFCYLKFYTIVKDGDSVFKRIESPTIANRNIKQCSY